MLEKLRNLLWWCRGVGRRRGVVVQCGGEVRISGGGVSVREGEEKKMGEENGGAAAWCGDAAVRVVVV